jgi:AcrR family transcriptional regulator
MARDPAATRDRLVDAFAEIVVATGARSATLEAVAASAGVSKGGLLYHFGSKDALVDGLLDRVRRLAAEDLEQMRAAPEGPAAYYVRTSATEAQVSGEDVDPLSRVIIATMRLAQEGDTRTVTAYAEINDAWRRLIEAQVGGDRVLARVVQCIGDGLWASSSMGIPVPDLDDVVDRVQQLVASSRHAAHPADATG